MNEQPKNEFDPKPLHTPESDAQRENPIQVAIAEAQRQIQDAAMRNDWAAIKRIANNMEQLESKQQQ